MFGRTTGSPNAGRKDMTTAQARKILGVHSRNLTDEEIQHILGNFYSLAEVIAEVVSTRGSKNKSKGLENGIPGGHNGNQ